MVNKSICELPGTVYTQCISALQQYDSFWEFIFNFVLTDLLYCIYAMCWLIYFIAYMPGWHNLLQAGKRLVRWKALLIPHSSFLIPHSSVLIPPFVAGMLKLPFCLKKLNWWHFYRECRKNLNIRVLRIKLWIKSACEDSPQLLPACMSVINFVLTDVLYCWLTDWLTDWLMYYIAVNEVLKNCSIIAGW